MAGQLGAGAEVGVSLVVDADGDRVVDLRGGYRDAARIRPWRRDTVTHVWSITKTVTSLAALLLVDAGELDVYAPVARYWPEFAVKGKGQVEVRHLLSHSSGVSGLRQPARLEDLYDVRTPPRGWPPRRPGGVPARRPAITC
ncbi:serine hydrolase domain-containing protein [Amycolatopsis pithecellobii]|uniref:serine hydrolase domain-containing protein n=1 Tax=Amycolatopsis pithecellobii TaxID=664692 RepID=UPI001AA0A1EE|nr:serine hydrolase domain-containing protein [Amycolatopsis pithecellobii]